MKRLRRFFASMAGRLFLILLLGMACAASFATLLANAKRRQEFDRQNMERAADRLQSFVELLQSAGPELRTRLLSLGGPGIRILSAAARAQAPDPGFAGVLGARGGALAQAQVARLDPHACMPQRPDFLPPPQRRDVDRHDASLEPPTCRLIAVHLDDGTPLRLGLQTQPIARQTALAVDPLFLSLLALAISLLSYVVARIASTPLQRLADAAAELGQDLQRPPLQVRGPLEVQRAAQAFNAMQQRLQRHLGERTQMLAAITHDLQTPSTRLRLRLENVQDEALRERLIGDLAAMQALIREGLELARSAETAEQRAALDLDSLLQSVVEDAAEAGADAMFEQGCGAVLPLRPLAMHRLFSNLVDNALKYGGSVRVTAERHADGALSVYVRDRGPGIAEDDLETVFAPFVRLETSRSRETGGAGLGLTIARALAEKDGATLRLRNLPEGGLEACVRWAAPLRRS